MDIFRPKLYFRADGNSKMGIGHVIRSLALVEMVQSDFECTFIIRNPLLALRQRITEVCENIIEIPQEEDSLKEATYLTEKYFSKEDVVVLDGYHFVTEYQQIIKNKGCKIVAIDDIYAFHFFADVIINHSGGISQNNYSAENYTQFYLGLQYALLRKPFREAAQKKVYPNRNQNSIFICLGGADPNNNTLQVLKKCEVFSEIGKCYLVIGAAFQYEDEINSYLNQSKLEVELLSNLSAPEMVYYMEKCGKAITSPSTIAFEYLSVGGELYLKKIADNQVNVLAFFKESNIAFDLSEFPQKDANRLESSQKLQNYWFDGGQANRFKKIFKFLSLACRKATKEDCLLYFDWANEREARLQSFNSDAILFDNHQNWFNKKLVDKNSRLYIILLSEKPVGQVRFDFLSNQATISFSLDKGFRGKGLGTAILQRGIVQLKQDFKDKYEIVGFVKKQNYPSVKAFRSLGFKEYPVTEFENSFKYIL